MGHRAGGKTSWRESPRSLFSSLFACCPSVFPLPSHLTCPGLPCVWLFGLSGVLLGPLALFCFQPSIVYHSFAFLSSVLRGILGRICKLVGASEGQKLRGQLSRRAARSTWSAALETSGQDQRAPSWTPPPWPGGAKSPGVKRVYRLGNLFFPCMKLERGGVGSRRTPRERPKLSSARTSRP